MTLSGFLLKPLATVLARAILSKLLKAELTTGDVAETLTDSLGISDLIDRLTDDDYAKKSADHFFLRIGRNVASNLEEVFRMEGSELPTPLVEQTALAVAETLKAKALPLLIAQNFDKASFDVALRRLKPPSTLAGEAHELFHSALQASSDRIFAVADNLPNFTRDTTVELLTRLTESHEVLEAIQQKLAALAESQRQSIEHNPSNQQDRLFEKNYRALILRELDQMELFGLSDIDSHYRPPISAAFIHLRTVEDEPEDKNHLPQPRLQPVRLPVAQAVTQSQRTLIAGDAGMGKTTLLRWLAVRLAAPNTGKQADELARWRGKIPLYLRLRDFPRGELPDFEQLPLAFPTFKELKGLLRPGWTSSLLESGRCVLLFDGLDEVTLKQCRAALDWLDRLLHLYPDKLTCIVTTRYSTLQKPEIKRRLAQAGFQQLNLQKMDPDDIPGFVQRWHSAMQDPRVALPTTQLAKLPTLEKRLLDTLKEQPTLQALADTPLLCAMICAIHQRRNGNLPLNRLELYKLCTEMLLSARDEERKVDRGDFIKIAPESLQAQVAKLAYWMMEQDQRVVRRQDAIYQLGLGLAKGDGARVLTLLLERCLLLRQQSANELEFVHGSFQEYLAASEIIYRNDISKVCKRYGAESTWKETILLIASHPLAEENQLTLLSKLQEATEASDSDKTQAVHILALEAFSLMPRRHSSAVRALAVQHAEALIAVKQNEDGSTDRNLYLSGTQVSDVAALSNLKALTMLSLDGTQVSDVTELRSLKTLIALSLGSTQVSDVTALGNLKALKSLYLANTQVNDVTALGNLKALTSLNLFKTQVSDVTALGNLKALTTLTLHGTQVNNVAVLSNLKVLASLFLGDTPVGDVTALGNLNALTALYLFRTPVCDVTGLGNLKALMTLELSDTWVSDVTALSNLKALTALYLSNTPVSDVTALGNLNALTTLNLSNTLVSDVTALGNLKMLTELNLSDTPASDVTALGNLNALTTLNLSNTLVSDVTALGNLKMLTELNLSDTPASDITALVTLPALQLLDVRNAQLKDLQSIAKISDLWVVDLRGCPITDFSPLALSPSLRAIWLDDLALLPADWSPHIVVNPPATRRGEGPWAYWQWLRNEKQKQE